MMAGATIEAVDLVGAMNYAEDMFARMRMVAESTETEERITRIANDHSGKGICIEVEKLGDVLVQRFWLKQKIKEDEKRLDDCSTEFKNLKRSVALLRKADSLIKLPKKKIKLEYIKKEEIVEMYSSSSSSLSLYDEDIIKKKAELKTWKQKLDIAGETLKLLKDAHQLCKKACDMATQMFKLRARTFRADFVEVVDRSGASVISRMCEMSDSLQGATLKFGIGKLADAEAETLEYICADIRELSEFCTKLSRSGEDAIDMKPGYLYELSIDSKGLCHFRQLTSAEATALGFTQ